ELLPPPPPPPPISSSTVEHEGDGGDEMARGGEAPPGGPEGAAGTTPMTEMREPLPRMRRIGTPTTGSHATTPPATSPVTSQAPPLELAAPARPPPGCAIHAALLAQRTNSAYRTAI